MQSADGSVACSVQAGRIDIAAKIGDEHAVMGWIQRDANAFHQVSHHDLRVFGSDGIQFGPVDGITVRRVATVGPLQNPCGVVDLEVDRLG